VARNAKFQPMYPLLEGVTVRRFGHSNKVLMNARSKCLSELVFPPSKEGIQKEITWGKVCRIRGVRQYSYCFLFSKTPKLWTFPVFSVLYKLANLLSKRYTEIIHGHWLTWFAQKNTPCLCL
jgi:hypothetical protein